AAPRKLSNQLMFGMRWKLGHDLPTKYMTCERRKKRVVSNKSRGWQLTSGALRTTYETCRAFSAIGFEWVQAYITISVRTEDEHERKEGLLPSAEDDVEDE
ncbi:hypothetical protein FRC18_000922, partial [Serendipita sp. 400]